MSEGGFERIVDISVLGTYGIDINQTISIMPDGTIIARINDRWYVVDKA